MMVEGYPNLKAEIGGSNPGCEISSLLDGNLPGGQLSPVLWRWPVGLLSQKKKSRILTNVNKVFLRLQYWIRVKYTNLVLQLGSIKVLFEDLLKKKGTNI